MVGGIERRRETLGHRVAAKDLENCLEDAVSIFEAAMKVITRRSLLASGLTPEEVEASLKKVGNAFQNVARAREMLGNLLGISAVPAAPWDEVGASFEKRHPITHNLGVADRKYLEHAQSAEREGGEVRVTTAEGANTLDHVLTAVSAVHGQLFPRIADARPTSCKPESP
jgi:hypothetical protein